MARTQAGFTLIEMIVSLALFATVSTVAVGALLVILDDNQTLRDEQNTITNVSFALDMMTRDIRTGYNYYCQTLSSGGQWSQFQANHDWIATHPSISSNCNGFNSGGPSHRHVLSFERGESLVTGTGERQAFILERVDVGGGNYNYNVLRRDGNDDPQSIVSPLITITDADIIVTGAERFGSGDEQQPTVTILLEIESEDGVTYELQTTATQRFLDL